MRIGQDWPLALAQKGIIPRRPAFDMINFKPLVEKVKKLDRLSIELGSLVQVVAGLASRCTPVYLGVCNRPR
jgi:hypothetical protein